MTLLSRINALAPTGVSTAVKPDPKSASAAILKILPPSTPTALNAMTMPIAEPEEVTFEVTDAVTTAVLRAKTATSPADVVIVARWMEASAALSRVLLAMIAPTAAPPPPTAATSDDSCAVSVAFSKARTVTVPAAVTVPSRSWACAPASVLLREISAATEVVCVGATIWAMLEASPAAAAVAVVTSRQLPRSA